MKILIEKINNKFLLIIILLLIMMALGTHIETGTWGMNKTVGWAWDLTQFGWSIFFVSSISFFFFYLILILLKTKPNKTLSIIQIVLIITVGLFHKILGSSTLVLLNLATAIILLINVVYVIIRKKKRVGN